MASDEARQLFSVDRREGMGEEVHCCGRHAASAECAFAIADSP